jgi:folate-binding protein YgfZ
MTGYEALRHDAAVWDVSTRGRIRATGEDRKRLLHAMSTNHIQALEPGQGLYAFFLNPQGRIQSDAVVLCEQESLLLDVEPRNREFIIAHLDKFIIADDVTLEDITGSTFALALEGPASARMLNSLSLPQPETALHFIAAQGLVVVNASLTGQPGYRIIGPEGDHLAWLQRLNEAGAVNATEAEVETVRIENGHPRFGIDITDANLVQETGLLQAVHFSKGCYLGQEIVERVRSQGHVNRLLSPLRVHSTESVSAGTPVLLDGKEAGKVTSAIYSPDENLIRALGYVRLNGRQPGAALEVNGAKAEVVNAG